MDGVGQGGIVVDSKRRDVAVDAANQTAEHFSDATFEKDVHSISDHVLDRLGPSNRTFELGLKEGGPVRGLRLGGDVAIDVDCRGRESSFSQGLGEGFRGSVHQGTMECAAHVERHDPLGPGFRRQVAGALNRILGPADHELPRAIIVRDHHHASGILASFLQGRSLEAENGGHGARGFGSARCHEGSPALYESGAGRDVEDSGADEGGVFADAVARHRADPIPNALGDRPIRRDRANEKRDLRVIGAPKRFFVAFEAQLLEIDSGRVGGFVKDVASLGVGEKELLAHARPLARLAGKNRSDHFVTLHRESRATPVKLPANNVSRDMRSAFLLPLLGLASLAAADVKVESVDYQGWKHCYRISNDTVELVVVPQIGRVMAYGFLDDRNVLWQNDSLLGQVIPPSAKPYRDFGGDKLWLAPAALRGWPPDPRLDGAPWTAKPLPNGVEMDSPVGDAVKVEFHRQITLASSGSEVTFVNTMFNRGPRMELTLCQSTQLADPSEVVLGVAVSDSQSKGWYGFGHDTLDPAFASQSGQQLILKRNPKEGRRFGSTAPAGAVEAVFGGIKFTSSSQVFRAAYPDRQSAQQVSLPADPLDYVEVEQLGTLQRREAGEGAVLTVKWRLDRR